MYVYIDRSNLVETTVYIYLYAHTYLYFYMYIHMYVCDICLYVHNRIHMFIIMYIYKHIHIDKCVCAYIYINTCMYLASRSSSVYICMYI